MKTEQIDLVLDGNFKSKMLEELFENSVHFPLAVLIIECLNEGLRHYFTSPDPYTLILSALVQAFCITKLTLNKSNFRFLGNLVGPIIYALIEANIEGASFFKEPQHIAFWGYSFLMTFSQFLSSLKNIYIKYFFIFFENIIRTLIPLLLYILFEGKGKELIAFLFEFYAEIPHRFLSILLVLIGMILGFSNIRRQRDQIKIKALAHQLKNISKWALGTRLLNKVIDDQSIFEIKRVDRAILFFDIRGFTAWSEKRSPEEVVEMLNKYYKASEKILKKYSPIKAKYTADEIMLVFQEIHEAAEVSIKLSRELNIHLEEHNLKVGGGVHWGHVVEGLIGGEDHKIFDVMGDTVNTAKRFCEAAQGKEVLISESVIGLTDGRAFCKNYRTVTLKGKSEPQKVFPLENYFKN
ncbi:MAG: adenylate/guanylate cyclase domain-containing protein [Bacteriovorax sp.]